MHAHSMLITMVAALAVGVILIAVAHRLRLSSIVLLLVAGVALGPYGAGIVQPASLGEGTLSVIVKLAVGLILFEGGLTLDLQGYRSAPGVIRRLLTLGVLVTWLLTAFAIWVYLAGQSIPVALLGASLVVVTGPTVIAPLLKRIKVVPKLHSILHWEGVLIDPVGAFLAILCFEWIGTPGGAVAMGLFLARFAAGLAVGLAGGALIDRLIRLRLPPREMLNVFTLSCALLVFGVAEWLMPESGLLAVIVAGFLLGLRATKELKQLKEFKAEITDLMIGLLFILLAARLEPARFVEFGAPGAMLVAFVIVVVRPANVLLSARGQGLTWKEKAFLSWVAPRGIVAASMASLFALSLKERGNPHAQFLETFTYSVIAATVILQGFTAGWVARLLGLQRPARRGWIIVGAHRFGRQLAQFLTERGAIPVLLVDTNARGVGKALERGIAALQADARDVEDLMDRDAALPMGNLLALTDNAELNVLLCQRWTEVFGRSSVHRWGGWDGERLTREESGRLVWRSLPKPSKVSAEISHGDITMTVADGPPEQRGGRTVALVCLDGAAVLLDPCAGGDAPAASGPTLYALRKSDHLSGCLHPELVVDIHTDSLETALAAMVDRLVGSAPGIARDEVLAAVLGRERTTPTTLGHGVAVPHVYLAGLAESYVVVGRVEPGLVLPAPDDARVTLLFLLVSPPGLPEEHLALLAEIARLAAHDASRERLLRTTDPEEAVERVRAFFHQHEAEPEVV